MNKIKVDIDSIRCNLNIIESDTTKKLIDHLPLTMTMEDLNKNEKYYFFNLTLPNHSKKVKKIKKGDTVMIVEAMKTMNHVPSTSDGVVKEICVQDGQPVEFGQTIIILE